MMKLRYLLFSFFILLFAGCEKQGTKPVFIATNPPLASIIKEIALDKAEIRNLLPAGESPHTFSPGTSMMKDVEKALAVFYVSPLLDGWASQMNAEKSYRLIDFLPQEFVMYFDEGVTKTIDPHFWTDPRAVIAIVPKICSIMTEKDPNNAESYKKNTDAFIAKLKLLDIKLLEMTAIIKSKKVVLFHPSFRYFLRRYGLEYLGSVESSPGKEPTPRYIAELIKKIQDNNLKSVFSETELPEASAKAIAEAAKVNVFQLDPLGGVKGRTDYDDIMLYNTEIFIKALK